MSNTQHDELAKQFTVTLASSLEIVSGETPCLTEGMAVEKYDTGTERLSHGTMEGVEMREVDGSEQEYQTDTVDMDRRWVDYKEYAHDIGVKKSDLVKSSINPNSEFVKVQASAVRRLHDKCLIDAAEAVAYSGKNGTTPNNLIANSTIAHGGTGFTVTKANDGIELLKTRGKVEDGQPIHVLWNARMEKVFKMTAEVANSQYSHEMVIDKGYVKKWGPLHFTRIEDFVKKGVVQRRMLPWTVDGVSGGVNLRKAIFFPQGAFTRWRPLTINGVVTWVQRERRFIISTDAYVGCTRNQDDSVVLVGCAETGL